MTGLALQALAYYRALAARRVKDAEGTATGRLSLTRRDACATALGRRSCGGLFVLGIDTFHCSAIFSLLKSCLGLDFLFAGFTCLMMLYTNVFPYRITNKKYGITACRAH